MEILSSEYFSYRNNELFCEDVPVRDVVRKFGTPAYIYSRKFFLDRYRDFINAFSPVDHTVFFAVKANGNLSVIKTFVDQGSGIDVNSEGELIRGLKAGAGADKIILTGVGKSESEIKLGIEKNLLLIKAESEEEVFLINKMAAEMGKTANVAVRINPDVDPGTHPYISTGLAENKFGVDKSTAARLFKMKGEFTNINLTGIDMHLGSQITSVDPYVQAVRKMSEFYFYLRDNGISLSHFDIGGGMGIRYRSEEVFTIKELADALLPDLKKLGCRILLEPGRSLTANGGIIATQVMFTKSNQLKNFIITDAAVNDLLRPSFYGSYHHIQPVVLESERNEITADIVGPVCESGDFLAKNRSIMRTMKGELLAVLSAGSYGMVMSSNYNARRRAPEIMVDGKEFYPVRSRENYDHLIYDEESLMKEHES